MHHESNFLVYALNFKKCAKLPTLPVNEIVNPIPNKTLKSHIYSNQKRGGA